MLILSSGRVVDIATDRAKYHALKNHGPAPDAKHRALYSLVDIIYRHRNEDDIPRNGWTEYDYVFSGYTLGNLYQAKDWTPQEKTELLNWVGQNNQKQRIETARRRLVKHQVQLSSKHYSAPQQLYSTLLHRLKALPMQRATVSQWQATITNMQQAGIRQEEINWSGLTRFLKQQQPHTILDRQQIINAIDFSQIRLQLSAEQIWGADGGLGFKEVAQRMPHQPVYRAALKLDDSCHCILRYVDESYNYRVGVIKTLSHEHYMALNKFWFALDPYGRAIINNNSPYYTNSMAAKNAADKHARDNLKLRSGVRFHTRHDHLTLYGGDNYREWTVSLPDHQRIFFGAHHFDHNVLLHIRTTTRHDAQGQKLLFIEEVQSDWHQSGQQKGYNTHYWGQVADAPFKKEWPALAMKLMLIHASQNGFDGIGWVQGRIQETRYNRSLNAIKRHYDADIPKALNRLGKVFNSHVQQTRIKTRDPWLNLIRSKNKWRVSDGEGKFKTRDKYHSRQEAMSVIHRHCKTTNLSVNVFYINDMLRREIADKGLPLFGESII
ncbi:MAG: hypothetical protein OEX83_06815 [Gammaproteobacteria bacterium]|nr:hypothetical protein [Gammaproteobacteria bacterium]